MANSLPELLNSQSHRFSRDRRGYASPVTINANS